MSPRAKGNIAVVLAAICGVYAFGGFAGIFTMLLVGKQAVDYPAIYPFMAVVLTTATYLLLRYRKAMRRTERGLCIRCGYDIRATPDRCPECGTVPRRAAAAAAGPRISN